MSLRERHQASGEVVTDEQRTKLRELGRDYVAAVSAYNDLDVKIMVHARDFAERPWDYWPDSDTEFNLAEQRERAIVNLAKAKTAFVDYFRSVFNSSPGV